MYAYHATTVINFNSYCTCYLYPLGIMVSNHNDLNVMENNEIERNIPQNQWTAEISLLNHNCILKERMDNRPIIMYSGSRVINILVRLMVVPHKIVDT